MKVGVIRKKLEVKYSTPQMRINFVTRNYGMGFRYSDEHSQLIERELDDLELQMITDALYEEANKHNLAMEAEIRIS